MYSSYSSSDCIKLSERRPIKSQGMLRLLACLLAFCLRLLEVLCSPTCTLDSALLCSSPKNSPWSCSSSRLAHTKSCPWRQIHHCQQEEEEEEWGGQAGKRTHAGENVIGMLVEAVSAVLQLQRYCPYCQVQPYPRYHHPSTHPPTHPPARGH